MSSASNVTPHPSLNVLSASKTHTFVTPVKKINEGHDVSTFLTSKAYGDIMSFLLQLNRAMFPCKIQSAENEISIKRWELGSPDVPFSDPVKHLRILLQDLNQIIDEVPLDDGPHRFGNISFRKWYQVVEERTPYLLERHLRGDFVVTSASEEVTVYEEIQSYFLGSFGSPQRLDYGSGHELSFLAFLGCIWKLGGFQIRSTDTENQLRGIVLGVVQPYLQLVRRLIQKYTLEPAGSHGVWGLDDHSFIPYVFGSAQYGPAISPTDQSPTELSREDAPDPADVAKITAVNRERDKNMYFGAIGFIHDVKTGPFWEHSPMLYDISGVKAGWGKINKGMIKMYNAEVLSKFPVVQHFCFGSLFSWDQDPNASSPPSSTSTTNQPMKTASSSDMTSGPRGGPPQQPTKAPWAATTKPPPEAGTLAPWAANTPPPLPGGAGTAAPRVTSFTAPPPRTTAPQTRNMPAAPNTTLPPSRFPRPEPKSRDQSNPEADATAMPPPTRAPWAK